MPTDIFLIRHGQTTSNAHKVYMGWSQEDLDETGLDQARRLANRLADLRFSSIYSSPLRRALSTAEEVAKPQSLAVTPLDDLIEIKFGDWQGLSLEDIRHGWPEIWKKWREKPTSESIPGGENFDQVTERALRALDYIVEQHPNQRIAVVSHEIVLKMMIMKALNADFNIYRRFVLNNCSISVIQHRANWLHVININDVSHLGALV